MNQHSPKGQHLWHILPGIILENINLGMNHLYFALKKINMKYIIIVFILIFVISCSNKTENTPINKTENKINSKTNIDSGNLKSDSTNDKIVNKTDNASDYKKTLSLLKSNQTIIPAAPNMDLIYGSNYKNWNPELSDIEKAEKLLKECSIKEKKGDSGRPFAKPLDRYDRQFIGAINENGDKIIWVNCFCKERENFFIGWKDKIVFIDDAGTCFFNVKINITKNIYYDLTVY